MVDEFLGGKVIENQIEFLAQIGERGVGIFECKGSKQPLLETKIGFAHFKVEYYAHELVRGNKYQVGLYYDHSSD